jgi:hypothetical protein
MLSYPISFEVKKRQRTHAVHVDELCEIGLDESSVFDMPVFAVRSLSTELKCVSVTQEVGCSNYLLQFNSKVVLKLLPDSRVLELVREVVEFNWKSASQNVSEHVQVELESRQSFLLASACLEMGSRKTHSTSTRKD